MATRVALDSEAVEPEALELSSSAVVEWLADASEDATVPLDPRLLESLSSAMVLLSAKVCYCLLALACFTITRRGRRIVWSANRSVMHHPTHSRGNRCLRLTFEQLQICDERATTCLLDDRGTRQNPDDMPPPMRGRR